MKYDLQPPQSLKNQIGFIFEIIVNMIYNSICDNGMDGDVKVLLSVDFDIIYLL